MRPAPLLSGTAPFSSEIGQLPVIASSAARGLERGLVRPADDHLPRIGDDERHAVDVPRGIDDVVRRKRHPLRGAVYRCLLSS
jgi:hypothetical protein